MRLFPKAKSLSLGLAVSAAVSLAAFTAPPAYAEPTPCMRYGLATCDPLFTRFSDDWWVCYYAAVEDCQSTGLVAWSPSRDADRLKAGRERLPSTAEIYRERLFKSAPAGRPT